MKQDNLENNSTKRQEQRQRREKFSALLRIRSMVGLALIAVGFLLIGSSLTVNLYQNREKKRAIEEFTRELEEENSKEQAEAAEETKAEESPDKGEDKMTELTENSGQSENSDHLAKSEKKEIAIEGDIIGILRIPSIDSVEPIREGVTKKALHGALGHEPDTANPGEEGNCVIAGHRNYTFGTYFNRLNEVQVGDMIYLQTKTATFSYQVSEIQVVEPDQLEILNDRGREQLTLYTCTPIYIATHRLVVIADRVS